MKRRLKIAALIFGLLFWPGPGVPGLGDLHRGRPAFRRRAPAGTHGQGHAPHRGRARHYRRRFQRRPRRHRHERTHVRVEKGTARVNFWPLLVGRISVRAAGADLVQIEVKPRLHPPPNTPPKFLPRFLSISAETRVRAAARHRRAERQARRVQRRQRRRHRRPQDHPDLRSNIIYRRAARRAPSASCARPTP